MKIEIKNEDRIAEAARMFLDALGSRRHVAFYAPMGAGKTTFTSALCAALGVADEVSSPTFSIINEYRTASGDQVFHFDFYRIDNPAEALDLGLDEYFDSDALCLMEWPENVDSLLPDDTLRVEISVADDGTRTLSF